MSEELTNLTTDDDIESGIEIIIDDNIETEDTMQDTEIEEDIEIIEVEDVEEINIEVDEAIGWVGGDSTRHYSLYGREEPDQHPITAITGLREELNDIEALDVVYSDERNQANYYLWEDENILQENRVGYFVSACSDINEIKICTSENDIFGVTVDSAGFIGAQADVIRDIKYGLVITTGITHVRCESSVNVGDYVISNDYGCAQKNRSGYKVVGRHQIDGVEYAEITLVTPIGRMCELTNDVEKLSDRMDDAETNIIATMNVANAAYKKSSEVGEISEEAIKNALEALNKSESLEDDVNTFLDETVPTINETAVQAKAIAESAMVSVESIRKEVVDITNDTLSDVSNLIKDLEPITEWKDPETGNTGAEYLTTYINDGLATKAEVQTVETMTEDNKSAILQNGKEIQTLVSSVDKYSVGEYSQAYGLTYEQAKSILREGMIYIPVDNPEGQTHIEEYDGQGQENEFTEHNYYKWTGEDWDEYSNSVAFFSEELAPSGALTYWYVDSDEAPDGYEAHTLYINQDGQWVKVNILDGNVNNRITSMIRQTANKIALDVVDTQEDVASHQQWLDDNSANIQDVVSWKSNVENDVSQIATIKQTADDAGASVALVVAEKDGEKVVNAASIVTAINDGDSSVVIEADHIQLDGVVSFVNGEVEKVQKDIDAVQDASVYDVKVEYALSSSDTEAPTSGWSTMAPEWQENQYMWQKTTITKGNNEISSTTTCIQGAKGEDGEDGKTPVKGIDYFDGTPGEDGKDGTSIVWKGTYASAPNNAENGWAYYNSTDKASYTYQDGTWYQMSIDGVDGQNGEDGSSIVWKGELSIAPANPETNWVYKDSDDGKVYIYNGTGWELMVLDGSDGQDGAPGEDGLSVFITYNDSETTPSTPTGNGTSNGWHTDATSTSIWMSQKVSKDAASGTWGEPIKIKGEDGKDGSAGISVISITAQYCLSENDSIAPTTGWTSDLSTIAWEPSKYIWCREEIAYSNSNTEHTTPRVDESLSLVGQWCSTADKTYINGGKIYTGSITTNQLATDAITSLNYEPGESGSTLSLEDGSFDSKHFKITSEGKVTATSGDIGGWNIDYNKLWHLDSTNTRGTGVGATDDAYSPAFWAGYTGEGNHPWDHALLKPETDETNWHDHTTFYVTNAGHLHSTSGEIGGWKVNGGGLGYTYKDGTKNYGVWFQPKQVGDNTNWYYINCNGPSGHFSVDKNCVVKATGANITGAIIATSGTIGGWQIGSNNYYKKDGLFYEYINNSQGIARHTFLNQEGVRINWQPDDLVYEESWFAICRAASSGSDFRIKNTIENLNEDAEIFFDSLSPCSFYYNKQASMGASNKKHFGFVAQDVIKSMNNSNILDFAGIWNSDITNFYNLDKQEFIALNTWQIQKAKARITELEKRVSQLEQLIKE